MIIKACKRACVRTMYAQQIDGTVDDISNLLTQPTRSIVFSYFLHVRNLWGILENSCGAELLRDEIIVRETVFE